MSGERTRGNDHRRVVALVEDLLFRSRIAQAVEGAGGECRVFDGVEGLIQSALQERPAVAIIDLEAPFDAVGAIGRLKNEPATSMVPVVSFGRHTNVAALDAARAAGADRVMPRSEFVRELPSILRLAFEGSGRET